MENTGRIPSPERRSAGSPPVSPRRSLPAIALPLRSRYSLLRGLAPVEELALAARRGGYGAFAICDRNALHGAVAAQRAGDAAGVRAIIGAELDAGLPAGERGFARLVDGTASGAPPAAPAPATAARDRDVDTLIALVEERRGWGNLCRLVSRRKLAEGDGPRGWGAGGGDPPAPGFDLVGSAAECAEGLIFLTASPELAAALAARLGRRARGRLSLLLGRPLIDPARERKVRDAAAALGLDLVAGATIGWPRAPLPHRAHLVEAMRTRSTLRRVAADPGDRPMAALPPAGAWRDLHRDVPEALRAAARLAERCRFRFEPGKPIFPRFPLPAGVAPFAELYERCHAGLRWRYGNVPSAAVERLAHELRVIESMGFVEYFLVVGDIVRRAREIGIECAGRGSGAASIVSYSLGITQVDPIRHRLTFERFLHPGRADLPDIDIDLCWIGRDRVIEWVYERYGRDRVAMISTHCTLQPRSAFREVARAFGVAPDEIDRISRRIPHRDERTLPAILAGDPAFGSLGLAREERARLLEEAEALRGAPHHLSIHPGGICIADRPIDRVTPLERAAKGIVVTQLDMYSVEDTGLVKIDLLGNRCVSEIGEVRDRVALATGRPFDVDAIPENDAATGALIREGRTLGCFQLESPAMRSLLVRLDAKSAAETIHAIALVRPGPAEGGMKDRFIRRARGEEPATPLHPALADLLRDQQGILLYEEDVIHAAARIAGITLAEGDLLRRAMKKAIHLGDEAGERKLEDRFIARAIGEGFPAGEAREVWEHLRRFGRYSFNKAHAAGYGLLAWRSAYLKAHHPREFLCALFRHHAGMYPFAAFVAEARRMRVPLLLPCVHRSERHFELEGDGIRISLGAVKGLSERTIAAIHERRPFASIEDLRRRSGATSPELDDLAIVGACDVFGRPRPELLWRLRTGRRDEKRSAAAGAGELVREDGLAPDLGDLPPERRLAEELRLLGAGITIHPMRAHRRRSLESGCVPLAEIASRRGRRVRVAGIRIASRRHVTAKGEAMGFLTLEDESGVAEVVLFPDAWKGAIRALFRDGPLEVEGTVEDQHGAVTVTGDRVRVWEG